MREFSFHWNGIHHTIYDDSPPFIVAEIGHNHGGNLQTCIDIIKAAKSSGCHAVKLQKRNNKKLYTTGLYHTVYDNRNSYGYTYGEHREALEFDAAEYHEIIRFCKDIDIVFFATAFDEDSVDFLCDRDIPIIKVQSGDCENIKLLKYISKTLKPCIISTGGTEYPTIAKAKKAFEHNNFAFLHCVSQYPTPDGAVNLLAIDKLREKNKNNIIGFSSHSNGVLAGVAAYMRGAKIIEQHFTIDRTMKGSDHAMSLDPRGMAKLCSYLKRIRKMQFPPSARKRNLEEERKQSLKLRKAMYLNKKIKEGYKFCIHDIDIKSPGALDAYSVGNIYTIGGKVADRDYEAGQLITKEIYNNFK